MTQKPLREIFTFALIFLAYVPGHTEITRGKASLLAKPEFNAKAVMDLPTGTPVSLIQKKGIWVEVKTTVGQSGWLKSYQVGTPQTSQAKSTTQNNFKLSDSRVTGVKGLTEKDFVDLKPNTQATTTLEPYRANRELASQFAIDNNLKSQKISYPKDEK